MNNTDYNSIRLPEEIAMSNDLYAALQGDALLMLAKTAEHPILQGEQQVLKQIENECFRVTVESSPRYFRLYNDVIQRLGFDEPTNFYIKSCAEPNACSILSKGKAPHSVVVHSSLLQLLNDDEIRQVIGHEIGHLIIRQGNIFPLLQTLDEQIQQNPSLAYKVRLWQQLSELSADRFGFLAVPDFNTRMTLGIKMMSGLDPENLVEDYALDFAKMKELAAQTVSRFQMEYGITEDAHPIEAFRLMALDLFSNSHWVSANGMSDEILTEKTQQLLKILHNVAENELELVKARFHASAGLLIASADGTINNDELDYIYQTISQYQIFPKEFLDNIAKQDYISIFEDAVTKLLEEDPGNNEIKEKIIHRLIQISFADQNVHPSEIHIVLDVAENLLGYTRKQAANIYLNCIHEHFMPNPEDIF